PRREDGSLFFPVRLADEPQHSYSWVELGKSQLYSLHLNSDALKRNKMRVYDRGGREIANVAAALESGQPFQMYSDLYYVRRITDWTRRLPKDRDLGKELEFFVLVRDPIKGQEITGDYLVNASESRNAKGERTIAFRFNAEGGNLFYDIT